MSDDYTTANVPGRLIMEKDAEITRLRADLAAVKEERDAAIEERDYVMAEGLFRDEQNEDLRKTVSKIWEQLGNPTYKELNGRTIHDLIDSVIYERNDIAARLSEENDKLRDAFEKAANDMHPMLRSLISRNDAAEIVRRAARAALEGVTEPAKGENNGK